MGAPALATLLLLTLQHFYQITLQNKSLPARRTILTHACFHTRAYYSRPCMERAGTFEMRQLMMIILTCNNLNGGHTLENRYKISASQMAQCHPPDIRHRGI
jgi:hypothetical protein